MGETTSRMVRVMSGTEMGVTAKRLVRVRDEDGWGLWRDADVRGHKLHKPRLHSRKRAERIDPFALPSLPPTPPPHWPQPMSAHVGTRGGRSVT